MSDQSTVKYLGWDNGSIKIFYAEGACPNCGAALHGPVTVSLSGNDGTFEVSCVSCDETGMLIERTFTEEELRGDWNV